MLGKSRSRVGGSWLVHVEGIEMVWKLVDGRSTP